MSNTPGELIKAVAAVSGVAEATVTTYYRALREAGMVTKGGRGPSSARPTPLDAAKLLIAVGGSRFEKQAADRIVMDFSEVTFAHSAIRTNDGLIECTTGRWVLQKDDIEIDIPALRKLQAGHSIADAVAALIEATIRESFTRAIRGVTEGYRPAYRLEVTFYGPRPAASIDLDLYGFGPDNVLNYHEEVTYLPEPAEGDRMAGIGDLSIKRTFTHKTIAAVAELMRADHYCGSDVRGYPLDHPWNLELAPEERKLQRAEAEALIDRSAGGSESE